MPFWKHTYHIVWATKNRQPWITPEIEPRLYAYLASKASEIDVFLHAVNGLDEHTHIVGSIPPKHSVSWVIKTLKGSSAYFINMELRPAGLHFAWQRGYGSLTIGERQRGQAIDYVLRQKEHHRNGTTHPWLERCEDDETDDEHQGAASLREISAEYSVWIDEDASF